jgi:tetraacyldisaccharide 4'-kinase
LLDLLYAQIARSRRRWFERHPAARRRLRQPVISVGNLSVGGTGKTPLVAEISRWLLDRGERPAILSRGYRRRDARDGVVVVSDGRQVLADLNRAGDEPLMLARQVPGAVVAVCADRFLAGLVAERQLGATVHVLDDGFQHVQLARDLDVLMTKPGEIASGRVLPFGRLREAADAAARAHVVVVVDADEATARSEAWTLGVSQAVGATRVLPLNPTAPPVMAVAGIADPGQFFDSLRLAGWQVARTITFADHHRYTHTDVARVAELLRDAGASAVVTTEKDEVRFEPLRPLPFACVAAPMRLGIESWDVLTASITAAIDRAREAA